MECIPSALEALVSRGALVLSAPPGSGKTTRLPLAIDAWLQQDLQHPQSWGGERVLVLQPRRLAARTVAEYMARLRGEKVGESVGYQVRFESMLSPHTRIEVLTEGLLTRRALVDPELTGVACVIIDEFHERSLHADVALSLLLELREAYRPDLRLVLMSATLGHEAERLAERLNCPLIQALGRSFPVEIHYESQAHQDPCKRAPKLIFERWQALQAKVHQTKPDHDQKYGSILSFFPGKREIEEAKATLLQYDPSLPIAVLYGGLPPNEQQALFRTDSPLRIVLATNIAETSITIEGISEVIDTGLARQTEYDPKRGLERLVLKPIAQDAADQRAGRAGRTHAGRCFRLWTADQHRQRSAQGIPELIRRDLSSSLLMIMAWSGNWKSFLWYEAPPELHLKRALEHLKLLGAVDETGRCTALGEAFSTLSLPPQHALALAYAQLLECEDEVALVASLSTQERDVLEYDLRQARGADLWLRMEAMYDFEQGSVWPEMRSGIAKQVKRAQRQILRQARALYSVHHSLKPCLEAVFLQSKQSQSQLSLSQRVALSLCLGHPHRITQRRSSDERALMSEGGEVQIDVLALEGHDGPFVSLSLHQQERSIPRVTLACPIDSRWLMGKKYSEICFDQERGGIYQIDQERLGDLCLKRHLSPANFDENSASLLVQELSIRPWHWCQLEPDAIRWLERVRWLAHRFQEVHQPQIESWWGIHAGDIAYFYGEKPCLSPKVLALFEALCCPSVFLKSPSLKGLKDVAFMPLIQGLTPTTELQLIEQYAPDRYQLPTGQWVSITYEIGAPPQISVYLQAFLGTQIHPCLGQGIDAIPLQLCLLAPNQRPVQITSDLPSFWKHGYTDVRKQLRARYAKHHWPEDPLSIGPQRGAQRRPSS